MRNLALIFTFITTAALAQSPNLTTPSQATTFLNISSATTTKVITGISGKATYITMFAASAGGANTIKFVYGTGTNCGTGTTDVTAAQNVASSSPLAFGAGIAPVIVFPQSVDVCITSSTANVAAVTISYTQF